MKKILLSILLFFSLASVLTAQDEAVYSHYNIAPILINPAVAGFENAHQIQFNARTQWTGFPDAPLTVGAIYNGPIGDIFGVGLGVSSESAAQITRLRGKLNFAFRLPLSENFMLGTGFSAEYQRLQLDNAVASSNFYQQGDQVVEGAIEGQEEFDASLGFWGLLNERTYFGLSFTNLVNARLDDVVTASGNNESPFQYYLFTAGHRIDVVDNFSLEPSVLIRQVRNAPFQMDFNLKASFMENDQLVAGISYRTLGAFGLLLGTGFSDSKIQVYYSYDVSFQQFQAFNGGAHEATVILNFKRKQKAGYGNKSRIIKN